MQHIRPLAGILIVLLVSACGGGGGGGSDFKTVPDQSASGIWQGQLSGGGVTNDISCLISETLELACLLYEVGTGILVGGATGTVQVVNGNQIRGSGAVYTTAGFVLSDGSNRANFTIPSGTVSEMNSISMTVDGTGALDTVTMAYDSLYDRGSSLATVSGVYNDFFIEGTSASFSIDAGGMIFSQTTSGCVGNGQVSIIDPQFNGYDVSLTVTNCSVLNGTYNGLAITTDFISTNDTLLFAAFTSTTGIVAAPYK
jgi:hypothetical protein